MLHTPSSGMDAAGQFVRYVNVGDADAARLGQELVVVGLAAKFNVPVPAPSGGRQLFRPGAFRHVIATQPISLLLNHAPTSPLIASTTDRSFEVWEGGDGLMFRMRPDSLAARVVLTHAGRGSYIGASIGFCPHTSVSIDTEGMHAFTECDLREISLVPKGHTPRFTETWVRAMSLADSCRLEAAARVTVVTTATRAVSYGGQAWSLHSGVAYDVPVCLGRMLVAHGFATLVRRT